MPTICMFFGLIIRMYYTPKEHDPAHFHVYYQNHKATVDIVKCEIRKGKLPNRQKKLVLAWAEIHKEELLADWNLCKDGEKPFKIKPLT